MNRNKYFDIKLYFQKISISEVHGQKHREQFFKLSDLYYWFYSSDSNSIEKNKKAFSDLKIIAFSKKLSPKPTVHVQYMCVKVTWYLIWPL